MRKLSLFDTNVPVLIFKANRGAIHHGAVGIARTLGRVGVPVYAIVEDSFTPLANSRYVSKAFVWKSWPDTATAFLSAMSQIAGAIGRTAILIPLDDLSAIFVAENAKDLKRWFLFPDVPADLPRQLANKEALVSLCQKCGVPCARMVSPRSKGDVHEFVERVSFPILVKAAQQWQLINDRYSCIVVRNKEALFHVYDQVLSPEMPATIILQEYIPGKDWIYHGFADAATGLFLSFTGKKLLSYPPVTGSTALGVSIKNETLSLQSESFLKAIGYSGITDMDWRLDARDGKYKIVDCNPRVGQNFRMFESEDAIDVVRAQYLSLSGASFANCDMIEQRLFVVESFCLPLLFGWRRAATTIFFKSSGRRHLAWWSRDDALPFFVMAIRLILRVLQRRLGWR
jgi:D-aspartate ligase